MWRIIPYDTFMNSFIYIHTVSQEKQRRKTRRGQLMQAAIWQLGCSSRLPQHALDKKAWILLRAQQHSIIYYDPTIRETFIHKSVNICIRTYLHAYIPAYTLSVAMLDMTHWTCRQTREWRIGRRIRTIRSIKSPYKARIRLEHVITRHITHTVDVYSWLALYEDGLVKTLSTSIRIQIVNSQTESGALNREKNSTAKHLVEHGKCAHRHYCNKCIIGLIQLLMIARLLFSNVNPHTEETYDRRDDASNIVLGWSLHEQIAYKSIEIGALIIWYTCIFTTNQYRCSYLSEIC